jgi:hypothetical protein
MRLPLLPLAACVVMLGALSAIGCTPKIGDDCSTSTDCSLCGDRLCDSTQPGGYCTVFNCEPDTCPDEAQCVAFNSELDPVCESVGGSSRFQRTFCMKRCGGDGDCRNGYVCLDTRQQPNGWGAIVVDGTPDGLKICVANSPELIPSGGHTELCYGFDGSFPDVAYYEPDVAENLDVVSADVAADDAEDAVADALADAGADGPDAAADVSVEGGDGGDEAGGVDGADEPDGAVELDAPDEATAD